MAESELSQKKAWRRGERELASGKRGRSKWLRLSGLGVMVMFASGFLLIVVVTVAGDPLEDSFPLVAMIPFYVLVVITWAGIVAVPVGFTGWLVTADTWGGRFAALGALLGWILFALLARAMG